MAVNNRRYEIVVLVAAIANKHLQEWRFATVFSAASRSGETPRLSPPPPVAAISNRHGFLSTLSKPLDLRPAVKDDGFLFFVVYSMPCGALMAVNNRRYEIVVLIVAIAIGDY